MGKARVMNRSILLDQSRWQGEYTGDILKTDAEALVNTVNCVGIMGQRRRSAVQKAFPENYKAYKAACESHQVQPGRMFIFETALSRNRLPSAATASQQTAWPPVIRVAKSNSGGSTSIDVPVVGTLIGAEMSMPSGAT